MNLRVERKTFTGFSTIGELFLDGEHQCFTLEPATRTDDVKPRAIPEGTYKLSNRFSPKHHRAVPHVEDVPEFEEIEIHPGNFPHDTEGCLLVGQQIGPTPDSIILSRIAFAALWERLVEAWGRGENIDITYTNIKGTTQ